MSESTADVDRLLYLAEMVCDGNASEDHQVELDSILIADAESRRRYWDYCRMHIALEMEMQANKASRKVCERNDLDSSALAPWEFETLMGAISPNAPASSSHVRGFIGGAYHGTVGFFSQEMPLCFLITTAIFGLMLLAGSLITVTHSTRVATRSPPSASGSFASKPKEIEFVGRITGAAEVKWSQDPDYLPPGGAYVSLGRKYKLDSGLLQITYDSGARVILEGPCSYEVESARGGYLALGKLTARVEQKESGVRGQGSEKEKLQINKSPNQQISNPQSLIPNPFFVRTPTAVVTDLGTEFGVEVSKTGDTTSHVFRGLVRVQVTGGTGLASGTRHKEWILRTNETVRVEKTDMARKTDHAPAGEEPYKLRFTRPTTPPKFVRRVYEPPKLLDLLDIVAGGKGTGDSRRRGIDPASGWEDPVFVAHYRYRGGDRQYRPVGWHRLIDGVFVPDGREGPVQLNSAGDAFDGFPETGGEVYGSIWSRAAEIGSKRVTTAQPWVYSIIGEEKFMPKKRGLLCFYANGGITFDLEAMRRMYPKTRPARFRATAGLADGPRKDPEAFGMADVWVFVDGRLKLKREKLRASDGTFTVDVELGPRDRFLTLAATDGGNGISWDSVVFGDPVLEMAAIEPEKRKEDRPMK